MLKADLPNLKKTLKNGLHFFLPVFVLTYVLFNNYSPMMAGFVAVISTIIAAMLRRSTRLSFKDILGGLETGARNAVMVSVACGCAGIIVGCVSLTGLGLKFSSLVVSLSGGSPFLAIVLIGMASLVLGTGLPVTASYIVLVILAGPALMDLGLPIIVAHMIVFWYSQDANVTPPVSLAAFAGAGIAGASPMKTGFASWKIAKGLYIIPIVMAYRPLLGNGTTTKVIMTTFFTTIGLIAFTSAMERFLFKRLNLIETLLMAGAALTLFWPHYGLSCGGAILLAMIAGRQWLSNSRQSAVISGQ